MYAKGPSESNLKTRFKKRLIPRNLEKKEPRYGTRWLRPGIDDFLVRGEVKAKQGWRKPSFLTLVGEMLPRESWAELPDNVSGVYVLFDSSETARYVGISDDIRRRLSHYFTLHKPEDDDKRAITTSFSVFMVEHRKQARELESLLIHVLGPALVLNKKKQRRFGVRPGVEDFESGTLLLQRKSKRPADLFERDAP